MDRSQHAQNAAKLYYAAQESEQLIQERGANKAQLKPYKSFKVDEFVTFLVLTSGVTFILLMFVAGATHIEVNKSIIIPFAIGIVVDIVVWSLVGVFVARPVYNRFVQSENSRIRQRNESVFRREVEIDQRIAELNKLRNMQKLSDTYFNSAALKYIYGLFRDGRADSWKEAFNIYEHDRRMSKMMQAQQQASIELTRQAHRVAQQVAQSRSDAAYDGFKTREAIHWASRGQR